MKNVAYIIRPFFDAVKMQKSCSPALPHLRCRSNYFLPNSSQALSVAAFVDLMAASLNSLNNNIHQMIYRVLEGHSSIETNSFNWDSNKCRQSLKSGVPPLSHLILAHLVT